MSTLYQALCQAWRYDGKHPKAFLALTELTSDVMRQQIMIANLCDVLKSNMFHGNTK